MTTRLPRRATRSTPVGRRRYDAIDGYRGLFVILVMLYHFGVTALAGGWVGINHFFVFSGFLITRLLVKEYNRTGRISIKNFYIRRARRIVPPLLVLVAAVLIHSAIFEHAQEKKLFGGDAFATLGFFLNWRLISRGDAYFDLFGHVSPLRHAWTLSVEEQFYVLAPLLVLVVCAALRTRGRRAAVVFLLAGASALWTAHLGYHGIADQARLYYATDTRAQAILVGVAMGLLLGVDRKGREPAQLSRSATHLLAWLGLALSLGAIFVLSPTSAWVYNRGGMLLFALGAALMGFAAIDQRGLLLNRLFSFGPLVYLGRISYGLYLYHWPIHLWLPLHSLPGIVAGGIQLVLSLAVAMLSFHLLELPVMLGGLRGLFARASLRRIVPEAAIALLVAGSLVLWQGTSTALTDVPPLHADQSRYQPASSTTRFALVGGSVASSLAAGWVPERYADQRLDDQSALGCDLIDAPLVHDGKTRPAQPACDRWRAQWPGHVRAAGDTSVVVVAAEQFLVAHRTPEGIARPGTARMRALIEATLTTVWKRARSAGATSIQVINLPCRRIDRQQLDPSLQFFAAVGSDDASVRWANTVIKDWVDDTERASLLDLHRQLCSGGYRSSIHDIDLYHDTVHFAPRGAAMIWTWLAPAVRDGARSDPTSKG